MYATPAMVEDMLRTAVAAAASGNPSLYRALEGLPGAIYVTDAQGFVTFFNSACIDFAGRTPSVGQDRWCVTWKLYSEDGAFLPHHQCPMAVAIETKRAVRGVIALAERPDGTRVRFLPYPTPLFGPKGELRGAINMLIDITDGRQADFLREQAEKSRRLAWAATNSETMEALDRLAADYEEKAKTLREKALKPN
jgi:PAS domain-containing protein